MREWGAAGLATGPGDPQGRGGGPGGSAPAGGSGAGAAPAAPTSRRGPRGEVALPARGARLGEVVAEPWPWAAEGWGSPCRRGAAPGASGRWAGSAGQGGGGARSGAGGAGREAAAGEGPAQGGRRGREALPSGLCRPRRLRGGRGAEDPAASPSLCLPPSLPRPQDEWSRGRALQAGGHPQEIQPRRRRPGSSARLPRLAPAAARRPEDARR